MRCRIYQSWTLAISAVGTRECHWNLLALWLLFWELTVPWIKLAKKTERARLCAFVFFPLFGGRAVRSPWASAAMCVSYSQDKDVKLSGLWQWQFCACWTSERAAGGWDGPDMWHVGEDDKARVWFWGGGGPEVKRPRGVPWCRCGDNIRLDHTANSWVDVGTGSVWLTIGEVAGFSESAKEPSDFMKCGEFLD